MKLFKNQKGYTEIVTVSIILGIIGAIFITGVFVWKEAEKNITLQAVINKISKITLVTDSSDSSIENFIDKANLPNQKPIRTIVDEPKNDLKIVGVTFGTPMGCPSGCIFDGGYVIKNNSKIGWLTISDSVEVDKNDIYDFDENDTYLFSDTFLNELEKNNNNFYNVLLSKLISDQDTPREIILTVLDEPIQYTLLRHILINPSVKNDRPLLLKITNTLSDYIQPSVVSLLLENSLVQKDKEMLNIITNLESRTYEDYRKTAKDLLEKL